MKKINYQNSIQKAFREAICEILTLTGQDGLSGKQHLLITFITQFPGVSVPEYLKILYPDEMTIVLEHEFWNLDVGSHGFTVTVCFDENFEKLTIPYHAIVEFSDPSEDFILELTPDLSITGNGVGSTSKKQLLESGQSGLVPETNIVSLDSFRKK